MKIKLTMKLTFYDPISAAYETLGACQGGKLIAWASNPRMAVIKVQPDCLIFPAKERFV